MSLVAGIYLFFIITENLINPLINQDWPHNRKGSRLLAVYGSQWIGGIYAKSF